MSSIPHRSLNEGDGFWDVLVAPRHVDAVEALAMKPRTLHENLAESIARESPVKGISKRQVKSSDDT